MDYIGYRERLGIGFDDNNKSKYFYKKMTNDLNLIMNSHYKFGFDSYYSFCNSTGTIMDFNLWDLDKVRFDACKDIVLMHTDDLNEFLAYYISLVNSIIVEEDIEADEDELQLQEYLKNILCKNLEESYIPYEIIGNNNEYFVFPKGAPELDYALISQPLEWLKDYPKARKTFCIALKQYSEGIYIRDVADNLRKALEEFLQEFLNNKKNLENNKDEICRYLGKEEIDSGISGLFKPLINAYKNINDRIAKHNDAVDKRLLEFLLYQTGLLIRMVLVIKSEEVDNTK